MEVVFRGQEAAADERLQEYARQRVGRLERYLPAVREAVVEVRKEKARAAQQRYIVQVTINANGTFLRSEERAADPRAAVDSAADALGQQVRRHKSKLYRSERAAHEARHAEAAALLPDEREEDAGDEDEFIAGHVVRVKRFSIKPMTVEEAVEQMELLGHAFFLFYNADEDAHAMLYRRNDGDYGLILPA
ncbi:MAG: ribosome-associated translation inhibitor RaiA [Chloroflexi bacterium]|nr:ribosome-associated translation inhibitor RaiA [Chloroflexota bacterium]